MSKRLNVLQVTTHDSGRHFGCYNHPTVQTPAIDQLSSDGVQFNNYFCTVPICSASRATQLTGLYPQSNGLLDLVGFGWRINEQVRHASEIFHNAGYRTMLWGVQHEVHKNELGRLSFDYTAPTPNTAEEVAEGVCAFLEQQYESDQPFYAQVGFVETHTPFDRNGTAPDQEKGLEIPPYLADTPATREAMAGFQGSLRKVDRAVGKILQTLQQTGLEEDTLLIFTTDHGIEMPRAKWHLYDPGIAIALLMRAPALGLSGGQKCELLLSNVDYLPTILELAGIAIPDEMQGHSFAAALRGTADATRPVRDAVYGLYHKTQARYVRTGRYKLIRHFDNATDFHRVPVRMEDMQNKRVIPLLELFDLENDPNEFVNVSGKTEYAGIQQDLENKLWTWMESVQDPLLQGPVRTPTYIEAMQDYQCWRDGGRESAPHPENS